jgi:hypothetical protein
MVTLIARMAIQKYAELSNGLSGKRNALGKTALYLFSTNGQSKIATMLFQKSADVWYYS